MVITKVIARKKTFLIFFSDVNLFLIGGGGEGFRKVSWDLDSGVRWDLIEL